MKTAFNLDEDYFGMTEKTPKTEVYTNPYLSTYYELRLRIASFRPIVSLSEKNRFSEGVGSNKSL